MVFPNDSSVTLLYQSISDMNRRDLLKSASLASLATFLTSKGIAFNGGGAQPLADCVLFPTDMAGPFPLDLSKDASKFRVAINEDRIGAPLHLLLNVVNVNDDCKPIPNARVDLWHNDALGDYSGFDTFGSAGETWCRGIQMTDANGQVRFETIYPGWYPGRATHLHVEVYVGSTRKVVSQIAFPDAINLEVYDNNPTIYTKSRSTWLSPNTSDSIFAQPAGALAMQTATVVKDSSGIYQAGIVVPIAAPVASVPEPETGGQFELKQNFPNPFVSATSIPFTLKNGGRVSLEIYNTKGERVANLTSQSFAAGSHTIKLDRTVQLKELPAGNYVYQFTCENEEGRFSQCKVMTFH